MVGVGLQKDAVGQCNATQSQEVSFDAMLENHVGVLKW
jgi:hypothetical protein